MVTLCFSCRSVFSQATRKTPTCFYTALIEVQDHFHLFKFIKSSYKVLELSQTHSHDNIPRISSKFPQSLSFLRYASVIKNHDHCSLICIKLMTTNSVGINACQSDHTEIV